VFLNEERKKRTKEEHKERLKSDPGYFKGNMI